MSEIVTFFPRIFLEKLNFSKKVPPFIWISSISDFFLFKAVSDIFDIPMQRINEQYFFIFSSFFLETVLEILSKLRFVFEKAFFLHLYQFL